MAFFGVETEGEDYVAGFVVSTNKRLENNTLHKNPFEAKLTKKGNNVFVYIKPIFLNIPLYLVFFITVPTMIFTKLSSFFFTYWIALGFLLLSFFWSKYFFWLIMKMGIRKTGYKGKFKLLSNEETFKRMMEWDKAK